ncbi:MAG: SDR family NAD(P)-dependent oxidoreductase, partial [Desulfuromonadaceae bacterium]|nr:SDR family NAD(P)-dependent oxidoreductase [Desulfuromonadaceae bacterium]
VSFGAWRYLQRYGIKAGVFGGHSYGELTALCAAHCYTPAELYRLSGLRGTLMRGDGSDKGTMLAVSAPLADIEALLKSEGLDLIVANKNTPQQGVLSGARAEIERAATACKNAGMRCIPLDVAAAFHSKLVAAASEPFHAGLDAIAVQAPDAKVYANKTGSTYPSEPDAIRTLLAQQIASPVEFVHQIEQMHADGITTFIEVGPGARLSGMVKKILPSAAQVHIVTLDSSNGKRAGMLDVARALAQLAALGLPLELQRWDEDYAQTYLSRPAVEDKKPRMSIKICGANSTKEREPIPPSTRTLVDSREIHCTPCPSASGQQTSQTQPQPQHTTAPSLQVLRSQMSVLQQMQEDTARLHEQFLAGQTEALQAMRNLMGQQVDAPVESSGSWKQASDQQANPPTPVISQQVAPRAPQSSVTRTQTTANPGANAQAHAQSPSSQHQSAQPAIDIAGELLRIVAEKTGYPTEMLELDMSLDADLGIDSIKRVEILAAVQEQLPELPGVEPQQLSSLQTLRQIVETLSSAAAELSSAPQALSATSAATNITAANIDVAAELLRIVAEKTGYPTEMLELDMSLDADLGIDSIKRVEILAAVQEQLPELPGVEPQQLSSLQTLRQIVETLSSAAAESSSATTTNIANIDVAAELLRIVAEKTGYPTEMLELDMSLDADLGIDSIKRVEILAAVQEQLPELPGVEPQQLSSLQTLRQIVETLSSAAAESSSATTTNIANIDVAAELLRIVAEKTGYPTEMLELDMSLDADLGIDSIKRVEILAAVQEQLPELPGVEPQQLSSLQTLRQIVETLEAQAPNEATTPPTAACAQCTPTTRSVPAAGGTGIQRQIVRTSTIKQERTPLNIQDPIMVVDDASPLTEDLVNALLEAGYAAKSISPNCTEVPQRLGGLLIPAPGMGTDSNFIRDAFTLLQRCAPALHAAAANAGAVFITLSRLDGSFGFAPDSILQDPISGGLAGLSKTAGHEWPDITCRALDLDPLMPPEEQIRHIVYEIGHSGPPEVGIACGGVCTLELQDEALPAQIPELNLSSTDVVVISGGGRGVTAAVALQLAQTASPTLLLLGRSAVPKTEKPWLANATTAAQVKQAVLTNTKAKLSPKELNARCERVLNQRELRCTIEQLEQAGSRVIYRALDIRDEKAVGAAINEARQNGTIRGIIHGAGVLADKAIADKTTEQFELVYSTKIRGLQALLQATADDDLAFIALFSSSTGRFGRTGQIDYAAANEVMNKTAQALARQRQQCRVVSLNWGPWDGGMVTPGLKKLFASEGISVIDLDAG